jgi:hypothetical protein
MRRPAGAAVVRRRLACCAALLLHLPGVAWSAEGLAAASLVVERPESDVLLLSLKLDQSILAETIPSYGERGSVLIPLGEVCRLLDLGITVDVAAGAASGFFIDERRRFSLDVLSERVILDGRALRFDPARIEIHRDDIYVDTALLSEWLPLRLAVDLYRATITVRPQEQLPLQQRLERERKREMSRASRRPPPTSYPRLELPYRLVDGPFLDQTLRFSRQALTPRGSLSVLEYSTYATGDLLFMEGSAFLSGTHRKVRGSRFGLTRKDPEGGLLGFLNAREVSVGDVFYPGLDMIASPRFGPGVTVSNVPLQLQSHFDRQSFRGDLPPGWEAELYRGTELLAYAQARSDGLYEFLDAPLLFGLNVFRVELYGPQGQRRSETRRYNVGESLTPRGRFYYRFVGNRSNYRLLGTDPIDAKGRSSLDMSAGLSRNVSASVSLAAVDLAARRHFYAKTALRAFWGFLFADADFAAQRGGGSAAQVTLQSRLGAFGFQGQHALLNNFVSERFFSSPSPLRTRTMIRLDTAIPETWLPRIPVLLEVRQDCLESGQRISELTGGVSAFRRGLAVSNQMKWSLSSGGGTAPNATASGQFLVSRFLQAFALRGELDYGVQPDVMVRSGALTAEMRLAPGLLVTGGVSRLTGNGQTRLIAGVSKSEGAFGFGVTADYSNLNGLGGSALLSVSIGRDARNGRWHSQARPLAGWGAASGRAFLDANDNGRLDPGEKAIPGAGFLLNGTGQMARTNEVGEVFLPNLSPYQDADLSLATSTLEDPFWKPSRDAVRILPRPGKVAIVDFPVLVMGEITGTVYRVRDGKFAEASGITLELVDAQGVHAKKVRSAFDGFYDITDIRPGAYTLRVAARQAPGMRVEVPAREVKMLPSGTVIDGVDFIIDVPKPDAPSASPLG